MTPQDSGPEQDDLTASRAETLAAFLRWSTRAIVAIAVLLIVMALVLL